MKSSSSWSTIAVWLLCSAQFGFEGPSLIHARDVPLHHKAAVEAARSSSADLLGRNTSEDGGGGVGNGGGNDNVLYYDTMYDAMDEENPSVTPPDVIYPNPDRLPKPRKPQQAQHPLQPSVVVGGAEAQEIKSSNFVVRGISSTNSQKGGNSETGSAKDTTGLEVDDESDDDHANTVHNNRVIVRPNEAVVDYELVEAALDEDFKGHDLIDSIMYIYYGPNSGSALGKEVGGNIIVIGAVVALAAQLLTIIILFMKHRHSRQKNVLFPVLTALLVMTFLANFLFIVGVQSSRDAFKCEIIAVLLHYLHLSTTFWVFLYIYCVHQFIKNNVGPNLNFLLSFGVVMPAIYIVLNYAMDTSNYEVANYCFLSVKKGMIFNYMIPISFFIVATALYGTLCLRLLRIKQRQQFTESIESFIEHSRSEQMLNQIRQLGPECPQQARPGVTGMINCHPNAAGGGGHRGSHRKLARCHSNPSSTTLKKSTAHLRAAANLTTSSINLTSTNTSNSMSPSKEALAIQEQQHQQQPHQCPPPCCSQMMLNQSHPNMVQSMPAAHCLDMMGTSKSICGDSRYSIGSISLANLSIQSLSSETEDFEDYKCAVKFAILFQIMFSICWFLAVIALEYPTSMMPIIYVIVLNIVNWILLAKCQAICPPMVVSPLSTMTATESHANSFSKKSIKSHSGDNHNHHPPTTQPPPPMMTTTTSRRSITANAPEKMMIKSSSREGNGSVRSNCGEEKPKKMVIPFNDDQVGKSINNISNNNTNNINNNNSKDQDKKKKGSVSNIDTIPLLAKSAGLRTDTLIANATIIDDLDNGLQQTMTENGVGDRSPPPQPQATTTSPTDSKLLDTVHGLTNGHAKTTMWSAGGGQGNALDVMAHRTDFISTIST